MQEINNKIATINLSLPHLLVSKHHSDLAILRFKMCDKSGLVM